MTRALLKLDPFFDKGQLADFGDGSARPSRRARMQYGGPAGYSEGRGIQAANYPRGTSWPGIATVSGDDALNREYLRDLATVQSRAQDLDVNDPNLRGFHRCRVAQILGAGVRFSHRPRADEVGGKPDSIRDASAKVDRLREVHSRMGGFDASRKGRTEGMLQQQAMLTCLVLGSVLIHRVWKNENGKLPLPICIELIPGSRISTPYEKSGDPLVSYGVTYTDDQRTEVTGYYVRKASRTVGDSFVSLPEWDWIPAKDASLLSLTEIAGIDRSLPLSVAIVKLSKSMADFIGSAVQSARAQAHHYAKTKVTAGQDPYQLAQDDANDSPASYANTSAMGFQDTGGGVYMLYDFDGQDTEFLSSHLPDPDFPGFMAVTENILARGVNSSLSRFTRKVSNSYAGGRLEDQQDQPIVDQFRASFVAAWQKVNEWFIDAIYLTGKVELPGYGIETAVGWHEFAAHFYGALHINPQDAMNAREKAMMLRSTTPQQAAAEDGRTMEDNLQQWAEYLVECQAKEKQYGLAQGSLTPLFSGRAFTSAEGLEVAPPAPEEQSQNDEPTPTNRRKSRMNGFNPSQNRMGVFNG